jgi:hypothetical protein
MSVNQARCTEFKEMKFNGNVIESPFKCDPSNPDIKCELYFSINEEDAADSTITSYL